MFEIPDTLPAWIASQRERLAEIRGDWSSICANSRGRIGYSWLQKFANGQVENPTGRNLMALEQALQKLGRQYAEQGAGLQCAARPGGNDQAA